MLLSNLNKSYVYTTDFTKPHHTSLIFSKRGTSELRHNSSLASLGSVDRCSLVPTVRFIDYEYACFNHIAFDIANHW